MQRLREDFDQRLTQLKQDVETMGVAVGVAIHQAVESLKHRDLAMSRKVVEQDDHIDRQRFEIEEFCLDLIATQQPMAGDLRTIISMLHITAELERMGDYAEGIAKISLAMGDEPPLKPLIDIPLMAEKASQMLDESIQSMLHLDTDKAYAICEADDEVDNLYDQVYRELLLYMIEDPRTIQRATYLLWVAHDLERIADRSTNIAERVIFMVTGKFIQVPVSRY